ncbi:MAG: NAD(P)-dependent oxidoreductase [Victivallaceae bacterium]|nr:NAD(P)-dependent oxidoreductase [Victivallaceae bacterium]
MKIPVIENEIELDELLSQPDAAAIAMIRRLEGDIIILGIGGKMGMTLGRLAVNAIKAAGVKKRVVGVSRFSNPDARAQLDAWGIETISCDLLDRDAVDALPDVANVIFMAGRKFGTGGSEELTWVMNTLVPGNVGMKFKNSRIVVFSTGCVYPLVEVESGGCSELTPVAPTGEYAQSCLGRERVFEYYAKIFKTPVTLFRLNYAIDLRYGVLHDIASQIWHGEPVNNSVGQFNLIWQGDANRRALLCLEHCESPASIMNITGPETVTVSYVAEAFGKIMNKSVNYSGEAGKRCYLNNAAKSFAEFGYPSVSIDEMINAQAQWIMVDNRSLGKPTHFEVNNGKF